MVQELTVAAVLEVVKPKAVGKVMVKNQVVAVAKMGLV